MPGPVLGPGRTTADRVKPVARAPQESEEGVSDRLARELTPTFDLARGGLRPGMVRELSALGSFDRAAWLRRDAACTQAVLQEISLSSRSRDDRHGGTGLVGRKITYIETQEEK